MVGNVLLVQPKNWAISLARLDFTDGTKAGRRLDSGEEDEPPDSRDRRYGSRAGRSGHREALSGVLRSAISIRRWRPLPPRSARRWAAWKTRPSWTRCRKCSSTTPRPTYRSRPCLIPPFACRKAQATVRQIAALYPYDNDLYVIEGNGKMVKDALENSARYYLSCEGARCSQLPLTNRAVAGFNYDMAQGRGVRDRSDAAGRQPHTQPALARRAARAGPEAAHRHQQLPRGGQRGVLHVRGRQNRVAGAGRNPRHDCPLLHG